MAPLPPPPPPAPPPPPPMAGMPASIPKLNKSEANDRNALLSSIRTGAKLKKVTAVNDRSSPMIDGKASTSGPAKANTGVKSMANGPIGPNQLGGLFAGGVPRLKPTTANANANSGNSIDVKPKYNNKDNELRSASSTLALKTSLEGKLQFNSNSQNNSFLHSKTSPLSENNGMITNKNKYHTINLSKPRERSNIISSEGKGQAPQVPTAVDNNMSGPQLPIKPLGVQRSNSQSNSRNTGRSTRPGPPAMKPPPPPKMSNGNCAPQPPLPSKPPNPTNPSSLSTPSNVNNRRQSFGDDKFSSQESWSAKPDISALVNNFNSQGLKLATPARNNMVNGFSQGPGYPPPPPPPISTLPSRTNSGSAPRLPQVKQTAPLPTAAQFNTSRVQPNIRPPIGPPPPPPPHRTTSNNNGQVSNSVNSSYNQTPAPPPPPSQTKVNPSSVRNGVSAGLPLAPQPPIRNTSISREEFAARFATFKANCELPAPMAITNSNKQYPSQLQQSQRRRDPPPPPPQQSNGTMAQSSQHVNAHNSNSKKYPSTPMLHIQFGSSAAQC